MLLLLLLAATELDVSAEPEALTVSTPTGARGGRTLVSGFSLTAKAVGAAVKTPLGLAALDIGGAIALTQNLDVFGGARLAYTHHAAAIPYVGARFSQPINARIFFGIEMAVSAALNLPNPGRVVWVLEPALLLSFTPYQWLEVSAGVHALSSPQADMWGIGPAAGTAFRVSERLSLLLEARGLVLSRPEGTTFAPSMSLGIAFH